MSNKRELEQIVAGFLARKGALLTQQYEFRKQGNELKIGWYIRTDNTIGVVHIGGRFGRKPLHDITDYSDINFNFSRPEPIYSLDTGDFIDSSTKYYVNLTGYYSNNGKLTAVRTMAIIAVDDTAINMDSYLIERGLTLKGIMFEPMDYVDKNGKVEGETPLKIEYGLSKESVSTKIIKEDEDSQTFFLPFHHLPTEKILSDLLDRF
ncbi:hypothetical protein COV93_00735 [Candidatus Woesearchaeota archaeon CG11_big_fil_rev_8_21_14_0_20_43_8]|nr:MAG: hypothetical protein COV93_00735 [Candidatus Woesearchaeota archaeon CG11_big_fil_rev_8_21_14_0_20_43_8]PIO05393.1 MAG: hypothetical protein COT47_04995 [Candidatus Woesearchaeota archaeon CG08_land_8_20_14_0_20_43_7]